MPVFLNFIKKKRKISEAAPFLAVGMLYCIIQGKSHSYETRRESVREGMII